MYTPLGDAQLKSGERMEVGAVLAPDPDWAAPLAEFLGHKGQDWLPQIRAALAGPLDGLQTRFYIGTVGGELACQTMVAGDQGVGILGHVYTRPADRRKGAIGHLFGVLMADCRRAFRVLTLGTEYDSPAYHVYHHHGFRGIGPGRGEMRRGDATTADTFTPGPARVRPVRWADWGHFNLLALEPVWPGEDLPRSPQLGLDAQGSVEGAFLTLQARRAADTRVQALALVGPSGATVGWALLAPGEAGDAWRLDLHAHPGFAEGLPLLVNALAMPDAPVVCGLTDPDGPRGAALGGAGFRRTVQAEDTGRHETVTMAR